MRGSREDDDPTSRVLIKPFEMSKLSNLSTDFSGIQLTFFSSITLSAHLDRTVPDDLLDEALHVCVGNFLDDQFLRRTKR